MSLSRITSCNISAVMVRDAVEELEKRRERIPLSLLLTHFQRNYPVERDVEILKRELSIQAERAVKLGMLRKYSDGTYALATLRWQATVEEFGLD